MSWTRTLPRWAVALPEISALTLVLALLLATLIAVVRVLRVSRLAVLGGSAIALARAVSWLWCVRLALKRAQHGLVALLLVPLLVFDNQMLAQVVYFGFRIAEVTCPTKYFDEASSINFRRSLVYGLGVLRTATTFRLARMGISKPAFLDPNGRKLAGLQ